METIRACQTMFLHVQYAGSPKVDAGPDENAALFN